MALGPLLILSVTLGMLIAAVWLVIRLKLSASDWYLDKVDQLLRDSDTSLVVDLPSKGTYLVLGILIVAMGIKCVYLCLKIFIE